MNATAHATFHIDAGTVDHPIHVDHGDGKIGVRIIGGPIQVWLGGTPEEIDEFLTDVRCAVTAAVAEREPVAS